MMQKILIVTVGGSHQPIVTAIKTVQPDRVIFICSSGSRGSESQVIGKGTPCEVRRGTEVLDRLPNIPTQVELGDRFQVERDLILIEEPDELSECYSKASLGIQNLQRELPNAQIMADYTGGTKTMSVGLAMAGLDHRVTLYITTGNRTNIIKVDRGELTAQASIAPVIVQRTIEQFIPVVLQQYNYPAAIAELKRLLQSMALPADIKRRIQDLYACCSGLDAWDRFEHQEALELLQNQMKRSEIQPLGIFLRRVMSSRGKIDEQFDSSEGTKGHGYEIIEDLLLNAERRATQERYDDAVGRLYRALELLAQIRLLTAYEIKTGDVYPQKLPESLREEYEKMRSPVKGKIQLALRNSYELLSKLTDDPLGQLYRANANRIINALETRNNSLFAHGFKPITASDYQKVSDIVVGFIQDGIESVVTNQGKFKVSQFPKILDI
ncbi:MAG: TIGR02710 family CRISPR-associated CARF protein [Cyanobacteriota bacterium]|nr:TIGR02710 family CRISPR-associated CARF protein [Cyanobacteriota bacterium]